MRRLLLVVVGALATGCPRNLAPPPACITVDLTCAPGYVPTFDNVYKNTLKTTCGSTDSSCHSRTGHMGGMSFEDPATAYAALLAPQSMIDPSRPRVVPGDPACSLMTVRADSPGQDWQMPPPPGDPATPGERCALIQWVACGATGPGSSCP